LLGTALALYARRIRPYALLAAAACVIQYIAATFVPHTLGSAQALAIVVDAYLIAAVSIGVARDLAGIGEGWRTILTAASERWGAVAIAGVLYLLVVLSLERGVFGSTEDTGYGLFIPPIIAFWGAVWLAQVVAAIEPVQSRLRLPLISIGRALSVSLRVANLGRLLFFSALLTLPVILQSGMFGALTARNVRDASFWANIPLDALLTGPLQAISTLFYLDFARRAQRK
jgi:hypothetical protein